MRKIITSLAVFILTLAMAPVASADPFKLGDTVTCYWSSGALRGAGVVIPYATMKGWIVVQQADGDTFGTNWRLCERA